MLKLEIFRDMNKHFEDLGSNYFNSGTNSSAKVNKFKQKTFICSPSTWY